MTNTTIPAYDPSLFFGAAEYYARYRSRYPQEVFTLLADLFQLDGNQRLLDLGCGAGLVAIPFSEYFAEVVAVDPDAEMLAAAQKEALDEQRANIQWLNLPAEEIPLDLGQFRLATFGRSLHWMQRELVLKHLNTLLDETGGIAILKTSDDPWESDKGWKQTAIAAVKRWLGDRRRAGLGGAGTWTIPEVSHETVLKEAGYSRQQTYTVEYEKQWNVESYLGYLYSTAFALPYFFGDNRADFERDLKKSLYDLEPSGLFSETLAVTVLVARR